MIKLLEAYPAADLYQSNKAIMKLVADGFPLKREDHTQKDLYIQLIDYSELVAFQEPNPGEVPSIVAEDEAVYGAGGNIFKIVNQLEIVGYEKRIPDGILYINGLPLVVFEFKSAIREEATIHDAFAGTERDHIHFYLAVRSIVAKLTKGEAPDSAQMNAKVREMISEALQSDRIEDIFKLGVYAEAMLFSLAPRQQYKDLVSPRPIAILAHVPTILGKSVKHGICGAGEQTLSSIAFPNRSGALTTPASLHLCCQENVPRLGRMVSVTWAHISLKYPWISHC